MTRWLWLAAWTIVACGPAKKSVAPASAIVASQPSAVVLPSPPPPSAAKTSPPPSAATLLRVAAQSGACELSTPDAIGQRLSTGADGQLSFDLPNGTRIHLEPNSEAWVVAFEPSAFAIVSGSARLDLLPQGKPAGAVALRVITSQGSLSVPNLAELFVAERIVRSKPADPIASASYFAILRGSADLVRFSNDAAESTTVLAGQSGQSGAAPAPVQALTLEVARGHATEWLRRKEAARSDTDVDERLSRMLDRLADERKRGGELVARIAPANAPALVHVTPRTGADQTPVPSIVQPNAIGSVAEVRAYQRALVGHAQRQLLSRQALRLAAEQSLFVVLARCALDHGRPSSCAALASWQSRFLPRIAAGL
ncbi:MAG TPA: hypothetical protein VHZ95_21320 [Polyangiales bacterium]|nr:hypothetical protein [Polyangiales bacterium]